MFWVLVKTPILVLSIINADHVGIYFPSTLFTITNIIVVLFSPSFSLANLIVIAILSFGLSVLYFWLLRRYSDSFIYWIIMPLGALFFL